jgi:hypothetical protein
MRSTVFKAQQQRGSKHHNTALILWQIWRLHLLLLLLAAVEVASVRVAAAAGRTRLLG